MISTRTPKNSLSNGVASDPIESVRSSLTESVSVTDSDNSGRYIYHSDKNRLGIDLDQSYFEKSIRNEFERLERNPKNKVILNRLGSVYLANGRLPRAKQYFKKAFNQDHTYIDAGRNLATTFMLMGQPEKADGVYDFILQNRQVDELLNEAAVTKLVLGNLAAAKEYLQSIAESYDSYHQVLNMLGVLEMLEDRPLEATKYYKRSINANPHFVHPYNNLGVVLQKQNKLVESTHMFKKSISVDPNYSDGYANLFNSLISRGLHDEAQKVIAASTHLWAAQPELAFKQAWLSMRLKKYKTAIDQYLAVLELLPNDINTINNIGFCYEQLDDITQAIQAYAKASNINGPNYLPNRNLMNLYAQTSKYDQAMEIAKRLISLDANDPIVLAAMGAYYAKEELWDSAQQLLERACSQRPEISYPYVLLGLIYTDITGEYDKAENILLKPIINDFPKNEDVYNNLVHAYLIGNKINDATKYLNMLSTEHPIPLATRALYELKCDDLDKAKKLYQKSLSNAHRDFKDGIKQRRDYDIGLYFLSKGDSENAIKYLKGARVYDGGFKYVNHNIDRILGEIAS